ncbi:MAG: HAD family hydrolase [Actinobacteria bacterium]|nr:HAD family hydrolase [Actinomycetota bacterium]
MGGAVRHVAAFDFDGTITSRDTLGPFLARVVGRARVVRALALRSPVLAASLVGLADRDAEKERLVGRLLAGRDAAALCAEGVAYANELGAAQAFRPDTLERVAWHRAEGHDIVVVSASLDVYLEPLGPELGVNHVICTSLEVVDGRVTGHLVGGNVRGPEKARRLRAWLGDGPVELWAYGDSAGDHDLLAMADHAVRV